MTRLENLKVVSLRSSYRRSSVKRVPGHTVYKPAIYVPATAKGGVFRWKLYKVPAHKSWNTLSAARASAYQMMLPYIESIRHDKLVGPEIMSAFTMAKLPPELIAHLTDQKLGVKR